jgi:hypothetical protein
MIMGLALTPFFKMGVAPPPALFMGLALAPCQTMGFALIPFLVMGFALHPFCRLWFPVCTSTTTTNRYDLCCTLEYHDVDGVLHYTAVLVADSLLRAFHCITSRFLAIFSLPA